MADIFSAFTSFTADHPKLLSCAIQLFEDCDETVAPDEPTTTVVQQNLPVSTRQAPPLITPQQTSPPHEPNPSTPTQPGPGGKPSPVIIPTPTSNIPAVPAVRGSIDLAPPTQNPSSSTSSSISGQPPATMTNPPASLNSTQNSTTASPSSSTAVESVAAASTSSHGRADPRIIVPVTVLAVLALVVGGAIIWLKRVKRRREKSRLEERPTPMLPDVVPTYTTIPEKVRLSQPNNLLPVTRPSPTRSRSTRDSGTTTQSHQEPQLEHHMRELVGRFEALEAAIRNQAPSETSSRTHSDIIGDEDRPPDYASQLGLWNNSRTQLIERRNEAVRRR